MSASEKLRAIQEPLIEQGHGDWGEFAVAWPASAKVKLWDALPEIIAVIEAAEAVHSSFIEDLLAALEEKLS